MAESNKNYLDGLSDEMVLKIFDNFDGLADRRNMAQVSRRFNKLAYDRNWRKRIFISEEEFQRFSADENSRTRYVNAIIKEINLSDCIETVTIKFPIEINTHDDSCQLKALYRTIDKELSELSNFVGSCLFDTVKDFTNAMFMFSSKQEGADYDRTLHHIPNQTTRLSFSGQYNKMMEKILYNWRHKLYEFSFDGEVTLPLLRLLAEFEKLLTVTLRGRFNIIDFDETNLPKIRSEAVHLKDSQYFEFTLENSHMKCDIFFSDTIETLVAPISMVLGVESRICSECPNLKHLTIGRNVENIPNEILSNFCKKLFIPFNRHPHINEVSFGNLKSYKPIIEDSLARYLTVYHTTRDRSLQSNIS